MPRCPPPLPGSYAYEQQLVQGSIVSGTVQVSETIHTACKGNLSGLNIAKCGSHHTTASTAELQLRARLIHPS